MNTEEKTKIAKRLFNTLHLDEEQYEEFRKLATELDLTIDDVKDWDKPSPETHYVQSLINEE